MSTSAKDQATATLFNNSPTITFLLVEFSHELPWGSSDSKSSQYSSIILSFPADFSEDVGGMVLKLSQITEINIFMMFFAVVS